MITSSLLKDRRIERILVGSKFKGEIKIFFTKRLSGQRCLFKNITLMTTTSIMIMMTMMMM